MFWLGSGWWQVAGLLADFTGFFILTMDVLPEYLHHRAKARIDQARGLLNAIRHRRPIDRDENGNTGLYWLDRLHRGDRMEMLDEFTEDMIAGGIDARTADLTTKWLEGALGDLKMLGLLLRATPVTDGQRTLDGRPIGLVRFGSQTTIDPIVQLLFRAIDELESFAIAFPTRGRWPLGWGIALIVLGFILQLWGSWPAD